MKKTLYITPSTTIISLTSKVGILEGSTPEVSSYSAVQKDGMDVKGNSSSSYNVWDDDWSKN